MVQCVQHVQWRDDAYNTRKKTPFPNLKKKRLLRLLGMILYGFDPIDLSWILARIDIRVVDDDGLAVGGQGDTFEIVVRVCVDY